MARLQARSGGVCGRSTWWFEAVEKPLSGLVDRNCQAHDHGIAIVGERTRQLMFARTTIMADRCRAASAPLYRDGEVPFIR